MLLQHPVVVEALEQWLCCRWGTISRPTHLTIIGFGAVPHEYGQAPARRVEGVVCSGSIGGNITTRLRAKAAIRHIYPHLDYASSDALRFVFGRGWTQQPRISLLER